MNFKVNESAQKLRGGYYTPEDLARFLARWVLAARPTSILEPSCGDGVFFRALSKERAHGSFDVTAFELDDQEARKAARSARASSVKAKVQNVDFLEWALKGLLKRETAFDAVVGNPPFVRYQYLPPDFQRRAEQIFQALSLPFTKHTNAWVPFILASVALLKPGGRLAMVVPAEIIHVMHAQSLRSFLGKECNRIVLVDPEELWFDGTLQGAVLLLAQKASDAAQPREGLGIVSVRSREFLGRDPEELFGSPECLNGSTVQGKWTKAFLSSRSRGVLAELLEHPDVHTFDDVAQVDVGIVTGANKYFLVTDDVVAKFQLENWAHPMFGRSEHCPGVIYDEKQHQTNAAQGSPTNFLWFRDRLTGRAQSYIKLGEEMALPTRYKCRVRSPWYLVPSVYSTDIGMLKRSHDTPRLILNKIGAFTTDTAYRIRSKGAKADQLVAAFANPLTALTAELEGRHYGGGVLELVPSEIEKLAVPLPRVKLDVRALDHDVRAGSAATVLATHGGAVLSSLGISRRVQADLMDAWIALRNRRHRTSSEAANDEQASD